MVSDIHTASPSGGEPRWPAPRAAKFRQAAFVYLHVAILYEGAAYVMAGQGILPSRFGSPVLWMLAGAVVAGLVFVGIYRWQNEWFTRVIWVVHGLRLPALIRGAFFAEAGARTAPDFYVAALVVVVVNLWMLARAGWDL